METHVFERLHEKGSFLVRYIVKAKSTIDTEAHAAGQIGFLFIPGTSLRRKNSENHFRAQLSQDLYA